MNSIRVEAPTGSRGAVIQKGEHFSKVLFEDGSEGVFCKELLVPVNFSSPALPAPRIGQDKVSEILTKIKDANVGFDDFYGDTLIPFNKVREIVIHELKKAQAQKQL